MITALAGGGVAPPLPAATIRRPRLLEALDRGADHALTLVGAPAGWGKTVLLTHWAATNDAAWLTLAPRHRDPRRLWTDVLAALERVHPAISELDPLADELPLRVADALAGVPEPLVIVLDDLHALRGPALAALGELVVLAGDGLRVVAATRSDPDLPLQRLRLAGRLHELHADALAFTSEEATLLLDELGVRLRPGQVARLRERTEGWAAGLRLAGLSLATEPDPDAFVTEFAGSDRAVADYLCGEVLDAVSAPVRDLLLRTSIADRVCGGLADALTGGADGARALEELDRAGMFIVPLDRHRTWFRYHALFAELLRARLPREQPGLQAELHGRAAVWLVAAGLGREAIPHALAAGDSQGAEAVLAEHWMDLLADGDPPRAIIEVAARSAEHDGLRVAAASACLRLGESARAEAWLAPVPADASDAGALAGLLRARARDDAAAARAAAAVVLAGAHDSAGAGDARRALAMYHLGATEFASGRLEAAGELLEGAGAIAAESGREWLLLGCHGRGAAIEAAEGRLRRAETAASAALAIAEARAWHRSAPAAWAYAALALSHWQRDELGEAERRADLAAAAAHASGAVRATVAVRALRAHLAAAHGDAERARSLLRATRAALPDAGPVVARWLEALGPALWAPTDHDPIARAAEWLAKGDPLAALRRVEGLHGRGAALHPVAGLYAWLIEALARQGLGQLDAASQALEHALAAAAAEEYRRPFVATLGLRRLLERHLPRATAYGPLVSELLDALPREGMAPSGLFEPLSDRERAVLRLLPTLLSFPEMAGEMFVSVNTIKTHVKSIYRKLDASSRRDAVGRARELRLI